MVSWNHVTLQNERKPFAIKYIYSHYELHAVCCVTTVLLPEGVVVNVARCETQPLKCHVLLRDT